VDLGVGIAVDTRSFAEGGRSSIAAGLTAGRIGTGVLVGAFSTSRMVEFLEGIDVNAERLEGVDGSIVGEGGRRTSATSSKSVSVILNNNKDLTRGVG
jgi:hypothetical protein